VAERHTRTRLAFSFRRYRHRQRRPTTEETRYGERIVGYAAALTYFYRNPELQMGEFSRMFDEEADAQAWVARYKGRTVIIHVDPRHPSRSVLRKEDL